MLVLALSALSCATLSACGTINPYANLPYPGVKEGPGAYTREEAVYQRDHVQPRCKEYAKEVTPSPNRMGMAMALNHGTMGATTAPLAYGLQGLIIGSLSPGAPILGALALGNGLNAGGQAYVSGRESSYAQNRGNTTNCIILDAGGTHLVPPSVVKETINGAAPKSFGAPGEWEHHGRTAATLNN